MRIGIDIDDTLTNYRNFFIEHGTKYLYDKKKPIKIYPEYLYVREIFKDYGTEITEELNKEYLTNCPVRYFATEVIQKLKEKGHNIYIITARWGNQFIDETLTLNCAEATKNWLHNKNIPYDKLIFSINKGFTCLENQIDIMLDDSINFLNDIKESSPDTMRVLMTTLFNVDYKFKNRVSTWPEFLQVVERIEKVKEKSR